VWLEHLPVKTEGKKGTEYLSLLHIPENQVFRFLLEKAHIFPFITCVPIEPFPVALDVPGQI